MNESTPLEVSALEAHYRREGDDFEFASFLHGGMNGHPDDVIAELIEADGRLRIRDGLDVTLERYLQALPDLARRPVVLDAAIDVVLRSMSGSARIDPNSVEALVQTYPHLEASIRDAASLNNAIWSTTGLQTRVVGPVPKRLPCDFGPLLPSGELRYHLRTLLGVGAAGHVYLAVDRELSEEDHEALVAIKLLPRAKETPWARQRLTDEAVKARRIDHPNVVRVIDRGVSAENDDYIVYEYVDGGDLGDWLEQQKKPLPVRDAVRLAIRIAKGVQAAHSAGLVHCDLKPGNIMMTAGGEPKVADFGIAIRLGESLTDDPYHDPSSPVGNLAFISPEQYRMEDGAFNAPSDIYSLGGILYLLLTGELPNGATVEEIRQTHDAEQGRTQPPSPQAKRREVDRDLDAICRRAMAIDPSDRYSAAGAFAEDLEAWLNREPLYWTRPSLARQLSLWARRRPGLAATLGVVLVLASVGGGVVRHYAAAAQEQALLNEARQEALGTMALRLKAQSDGGLKAYHILPKMWMLEWLLGPDGLGDPDGARAARLERLDATRMAVEAAERDAHPLDIQVLFLKTSLAYFLLTESKVEEAKPMLHDLRETWSEVARPDDPFLDDLDTLIACARVLELKGGAPLKSDDELATLETLLLERHRAAREEYSYSAITTLTAKALERLYSEELLNKPETPWVVEDGDDPERASGLK